MDIAAQKKYHRIIESLEDVADCINGELVLVGGTALAIFYLNHRLSVDIDLVPLKKDFEVEMKQKLKGAFSKKGYKTSPAKHWNQFIIHFDNTAVKVEVFNPSQPIGTIEEKTVGRFKLKVASLEDLLNMKYIAYKDRLEGRDLYDIICILKKIGKNFDDAIKLVKEYGQPKNIEGLQGLLTEEEHYKDFQLVIQNAH